MKILVRHAKTGLYVGQDRAWVPQDQARTFRAIDEAGRVAWNYEEADVVLSYDEPRCELALNPVYCAPDLFKPQPLGAAA